jgi:hypothetical protein
MERGVGLFNVFKRLKERNNGRSVGWLGGCFRFKPIHLAQSFAPTIERTSVCVCVRVRVTGGRAGVWVRVWVRVHPCRQKAEKSGAKSQKAHPPWRKKSGFLSRALA